MRGACSILLAAALWAAGGPAGAQEAPDWFQFSGPLRNGSSPAHGVFSGPFRLREVWRRPVDRGLAGLTVVGNRIFSLASLDGTDYAFALDAGTGKELWRFPLDASVAAQEWGAVSTPASDGRRVFVLSANCKLHALEAETGKSVWMVDFKTQFNPGPMSNGCWTSPLLEGDRLVMQVNGEPDKMVVAFDKSTGAVLWGSPGTRVVRTSPAVTDIEGVRQLLLYHGTPDEKGGLYALRPADGSVLWKTLFPAALSYSFDPPVAMTDGRIAVIAWDEARGVQVRKQGEGFTAAEIWANRDIRAEIQPATQRAVFHDGYLYGFGGELLSCIDAATGKTVWREKTYPGSLIAVDGHLIVQSQAAGLLRVVEATPAGYREKARLNVFTPGAPADTPPSFAGGRIYLRNSEEIVALEVGREEGKKCKTSSSSSARRPAGGRTRSPTRSCATGRWKPPRSGTAPCRRACRRSRRPSSSSGAAASGRSCSTPPAWSSSAPSSAACMPRWSPSPPIRRPRGARSRACGRSPATPGSALC
jgi:outer membrane protein assembly factor BamB